MARSAPIILDDDDPRPRRSAEPMETVRIGFEWGLASTIIGAILLLAVPITMLMVLQLFDHATGRNTEWAELGVGIGVIGALVLNIIGIVFGMRGIRFARQSRHPIAVPLSGFLLCFASLVAWAFMALLLIVMETQPRWAY